MEAKKTLKVVMELAADQFTVTAKKAGQTVRELKGNLDGVAGSARHAEVAIHRVGRGFRETILTLGALRFLMMDIDDVLLRFPKSIAKSSGEFQRLQTLFEGLSKSTDEATRRLEGFRDLQNVISVAKNSPFDVTAIADSFVKFKTAGLDPVNGGVKALIDGVAKAGGSSEVLKRASVAIQQMAGKGVISMEELRQQLGEAVPNAMQLMADGMGITMQELTKRVSKGSVEARHALAKMFAQMELDAHGAASKMLNTLPGAIERLKTEFELFKNEVGGQGFTSALQIAAKQLTDFLSSEEGHKFAQDVGGVLRDVTSGIIALGKAAYDNAAAIKVIFAALFSAYGGSKLFGLIEGVRALYAKNQEVLQQQADQRKAQINQEIEKLRERNRAFSEGIRSNIAEIDRRKAAIESATAGEVAKHNQALAAAKKAQAADVARLEELIRVEKELDDRRRAMMSSGKSASLLGGGSKPVVDAGEYEQIRQRTVAISAEAEAIAKRQSIHERDIRTAQQGIQTANTKRAADLQSVAAIQQMNQGLTQHIQSNNKLIAQQRSIAAATQSAVTGIIGFGKSLLMNLGYAAAFAGAVWLITKAFDKMSESARKAEEDALRAMRAKNNQGTQNDLDSNKERLADLTAELDNLTKGYERLYKANAFRPEGAGGAMKQVAFRDSQAAKDMLAKMQEVRGSIEQLTKERKDLEQTVERATRESNVASLMQKFNGDLEKSLQDSGIFERQQQAAKDGDTKAKVKLQEELVNARVKFWEDLAAKYRSADQKGLSEQDKTLAAQVYKAAADARANMKLVTEQGPVMGSQGSSAPKRSPIQEFIERQNESAIQALDTAEAYFRNSKTAADIYAKARHYIETKVNNGNLNDLGPDGKTQVKPKSDRIEQAVKALAENQIARLGEQSLAKLSQFNDQLEPELDRLDEMLQDGKAAGAGPMTTRFSKLIAGIDGYQEVLRKKFKEMGEDYDKFLAGVKGRAAQIDLESFVVDMHEKNRQMQAESDDDAIARSRERARIEIENAQKVYAARAAALLAIGTLDEKQIADLRKASDELAAYIKGVMDKLGRDTRTPIEQMLVEWKKGFQSLQQASANWADNFVDTFVDGIAKGKIEWGSFVKGVLSDILKIQMKQQLANAISPQGANGAVSSLGSFLGLGGGAEGGGVPRGVGGALLVQDVTDAQGSPIVKALEDGDTKQTSWLSQIKDVMGKLWGSLEEGMGKLASSFLDGLQSLASAFQTGGGGDGGWMSSLVDAAAAYFGGGSGSSGTTVTPSARGNIMTHQGPRRLRSYGVSKKHAYGEYSEGDKPEAIIPLPDGRAVPVAMMGGGGASQAPNVSVNMINQTGQSVSAKPGSTRFDGRQLVLDVVMSGLAQPGAFRDNVRAAMGK